MSDLDLISKKMPDPPGKSLTKLTIDLLKLAADKGFPNQTEYFDPLEVKSWRHDEFAFCAVVCAAIQLWLRKQHNVVVWAEPTVPVNRFFSAIHTNDYVWHSGSIFTPAEYEDALIKGLTHALENL